MSAGVGTVRRMPRGLRERAAIGVQRRVVDLVLIDAESPPDPLREQPIGDRHVEADRPRIERLAAHPHDVFQRRGRGFAPTDHQPQIVSPDSMRSAPRIIAVSPESVHLISSRR